MTDARNEARVVAQAKVNLFLRVLAREANGYHQIETLFQRVDLGDDVTVRVGVRGRSVDTRGADVGPPERDLAWRAAVAYADAAGWPNGFAVEVEKRVPVGGGLGGGSADAGAVLRCLDRLNPRPLGTSALLAVAATLGADVPFLTCDHALALAWGRGERLLPLASLPTREVHLGVFKHGVSTRDVFESLAASGRPAAPRPVVWTADRLATWDSVALVATNDLEPPAFALRPEIGELRQFFTSAAREYVPPDAAVARGDSTPFALMTGSGATVMLIVPRGGTPWSFQVRAVNGGGVSTGNGLSIVATETAERVAEIEVRG